ncbi:MAG: hypothetical protein AB1515_00175 [Nitrospirota bacterium]
MHAVSKEGRMAYFMLIGLLVSGLAMLLPGTAWAGGGGQELRHSGASAFLIVAGTSVYDQAGRSRRSGGMRKTLTVNTSFSISTVRDVYVYTYWENLFGEHDLIILVYSPDGQLYQKRVVPISIGQLSSSTRQVPGVENVVDVQRTTPLGRYEVSTVQLPIAGTWITEHRLLGTWRVDVLLDKASAPVTSGTFIITE